MSERVSDTRHFVYAPDALALASDSVILSDGTIWTHAATLGTYVKGKKFSIDRGMIENCIKVFRDGFPQKIPVDYNHGFTDNDPAVRVARAKGEVPKAGEVAELRGVFSVVDFTDELRTTAEKLATKRGRKLDDPKNFGLWMRWEPTPKALTAIRAKELTEVSIAVTDHCVSNTTGEDQGPAILAVGLVDRPHLDGMLAVAASQGDSTPGDPGSTRSSTDEEHTMKNLLTSLAAVAGAPVANEDEGVVKVTELGQRITSLSGQVNSLTAINTALTALAAELDESDPAKAVDKLRALKAENKRFSDEQAALKKARVDAQVAEVRQQFEKKVTPAFFDNVCARQLRQELDSGKVKPEDTDTVKALKALPEHGITERASLGDAGGSGAGATGDDKAMAKVKEILNSNEEVKELRKKSGEYAAYMRACEIAEQEDERTGAGR